MSTAHFCNFESSFVHVINYCLVIFFWRGFEFLAPKVGWLQTCKSSKWRRWQWVLPRPGFPSPVRSKCRFLRTLPANQRSSRRPRLDDSALPNRTRRYQGSESGRPTPSTKGLLLIFPKSKEVVEPSRFWSLYVTFAPFHESFLLIRHDSKIWQKLCIIKLFSLQL